MLTDAPVIAVVTTTDLKRAKDFYIQKLGLKPQGTTPAEDEVAMFTCGKGTILQVYRRDEAPKATNTVAAFGVGDVEDVVAKLRKNGIRFEEYDLPGIRTVNGIATDDDMKAAWFKDPDGNILALYQLPV